MPDPIEARGIERATHALNGVSKRAGDIRDSSYKIRTIFRNAEKERFASNGRGSWDGLADSTKEYKARENQDPRVLRASNALYKSLTAPRAREQIDARERDELRFGTEVPYAVFHDQGRGVPTRTLIDLTPQERRRIDVALEKYIAEGTDR
jgi:phage gpG-like protein